MKEVIRKIYAYVDNKFYFKLLYLFVSLTFVTVLKNAPVINKLKYISLAWGIILILFMIIEDYKRKKIYKFDIPLGAFMILTLAFNIIVYRNAENIKDWMVNLILFIGIFSVDIFKDKKTTIKEINIMTYFYVIFMLTASSVSLMMRFLEKTIEVNGILFGTTSGIFDNKNAISIAAGLSVNMCIYLNYITQNKKLKIFWLGNIVLQAITMIVFQGRSAYLILIAVAYTFIFVYNKNKSIRVVLLLMPLLICIAFFEVENNNIQNFTTGRSSLWTSASVVIKDHPLTGVGNDELVKAVASVHIDWDLSGVEFGGVHNTYVQIATVNGIVSLLTFCLFLGSVLMFIIQHLDKLQKEEKFQMTVLTSLIVGILSVNLFESTLIYIVSFISMIFWIYLGYIVSILDNENMEL